MAEAGDGAAARAEATGAATGASAVKAGEGGAGALGAQPQWVPVPGLGQQQVLNSWPLQRYHLMPVLRQVCAGVRVSHFGHHCHAMSLNKPLLAMCATSFVVILFGV